MVICHSVAVTYANKGFAKVSKHLVVLENHKYTNDHENSLIEKNYFLAFINCYIGLFAAALWDRSYAGLSFSLSTILVFKQIIVNLIELVDPYCSKPKKFREQQKAFELNNKEVYVNENDRSIHEDCERQIEMSSTPEFNVGSYNELIIQFGWLTFFSIVFPLGPVCSILSCLLQVKTEINTMTKFQRRDRPQATTGVGSWLGIIEIASYLSVFCGTFFILFTSTQVYDLTDKPAWEVILDIILLEHLFVGLKKVIELAIPD